LLFLDISILELSFSHCEIFSEYLKLIHSPLSLAFLEKSVKGNLLLGMGKEKVVSIFV